MANETAAQAGAQQDEGYFEVLMARFWGSFGSGAGMAFADECVQVARNKGYYHTIRRNAEKFRRHPEELQAAMNCCLRTGHLAAQRAIHEQRDEISGEDFDVASDEVQGRIARVRERSEARGEDVSARAGVCAALTV